MTAIGRNIRVIRESLGMTQEELARKAGYKNGSAIAGIEHGSVFPAYEKIKDIANALGVSIYQIKGRTRKIPEKESYYTNADVIALDLLSPMISEMSDEELDKLMDYGNLLLRANGKSPAWKKYEPKKQR